ncbi:hypothetical protein [Ilumatobacter sp.]|uniref:hypothetical protein n=1 Tax=Ilumatobacter sp. TaxID=1967498 RepID=UPI003B52FC68
MNRPPNPSRAIRRLVAVVAVPGLLVAGCSSEPTQDDEQLPADAGTVVPPDSAGVGGGAPIDNLDPVEGADDVDGDGEPDE